MNIWLDRIAFLQILNYNNATKFDAEGGVLKVSHLYMFSRQRMNCTFAAPPVGEIYGIK